MILKKRARPDLVLVKATPLWGEPKPGLPRWSVGEVESFEPGHLPYEKIF